MMIPPSSLEQQQQKRKFQPCKFGCQTMITFDAKLGRTAQGGCIPMLEDSKHQIIKDECPIKKKPKPPESDKQAYMKRRYEL